MTSPKGVWVVLWFQRVQKTKTDSKLTSILEPKSISPIVSMTDHPHTCVFRQMLEDSESYLCWEVFQGWRYRLAAGYELELVAGLGFE